MNDTIINSTGKPTTFEFQIPYLRRISTSSCRYSIDEVHKLLNVSSQVFHSYHILCVVAIVAHCHDPDSDVRDISEKSSDGFVQFCSNLQIIKNIRQVSHVTVYISLEIWTLTLRNTFKVCISITMVWFSFRELHFKMFYNYGLWIYIDQVADFGH